MNIYDASLFTAPDCLPCCTPAPADCSCALLIPPFEPWPYADYATAETAIADQTNGCISYYEFTGDTNNTLAASFDGTTFVLAATSDAVSPLPAIEIFMWASISLLGGDTVSIAYAITTDGGSQAATAELYPCAGGAAVSSDTSTSASGTLTLTAPSGGEYFIKINSNASTVASTNHFTASITSSDVFWVNPVIALWDDSGTTRSLWACPKLLLPPLTESTGTWYADCAAAADDITDFSSNCFGYFEPSAEVATFSANGGGSLNYDFVATTVAANTGVMWGSFNADSGDIITVAQDGDPGGIFVQIYDYDGVLVEDFSTSSGVNSVASSALPYTGRYTIKIQVIFPPPAAPFTSLNVDVTSSGSLDPNSIQARYDLGLTCAGLLNCGDSCP